MKILFLTDGIHPFQLGGMQKHSLILSRLLAERGVRLHLVHIGGEGYTPSEFKQNYSAEIEFIEEMVIPFPEGDRFPGHYLRANKKYSEAIYLTLTDRMGNYDLIYGQGFTAWHFIKEKRKGKIIQPILVNFHGFEMFQKAANTKAKFEQLLFRKAVKHMVLNADGVYSFGGKIYKVIRALGVPRDKVLPQSNGIEENWLINRPSNKIQDQKRTLTFVGRNERRKGIEELNKALGQIIKREDLSFRFNFIGPIPEEIRLKDHRIIYYGELKNADEIKKVLRHSDCLVCPSHSEGMPTVILEGMASGLAIIATDVGAVARQVKRNGILLLKPDPILLERAIKEMIEMNVKRLNRMKEDSVLAVRNQFLWEVIAEKKITQFKRILAAED